jgi:hypothetical protein
MNCRQATGHAPRLFPLFTSQLPQPRLYALSSLSNPWIADPPILLKRALFPYQTHSHSCSIFLKSQPVPRSHSQSPPNFDWNRDPSSAQYLRLYSHCASPVLQCTPTHLIFPESPRLVPVSKIVPHKYLLTDGKYRGIMWCEY